MAVRDDCPEQTAPYGSAMNKFKFLIRETVRQWQAHRVPRMGAALSFYTVFSLAPLAIVTLSLVSLAVARNTASTAMVDQVGNLVGSEGADTVKVILSKAADVHAGAWGTMLGFAVLLVGASGVFGELQDSLNEIWDLVPRRHPVFARLKGRAISFAMVLVMSLLMLLSFLFSAGVAMAGTYLHGLSPGLDGAWELGNSGLSLLMTVVLFALIYRVVPDTRILWRDVWAGALIAAVLFVVGKIVLAFYFGRSAIASDYGPAGPLIIILLWVFYSAQIFLFGAEFTRVHAMHYGSRRISGGSPKAA
jgi:membrane protein